MKATVLLFLFAALAVLALAGYLATSAPMPGELSARHAAALPPGDCRVCHGPQGLTAGCLGCHGEIRRQLLLGEGYHGWLADRKEECRDCHGEHYGRDYPLVNSVSWEGRDPAAFRHEHVDFRLTGAHAILACPACHNPALGRLDRPLGRPGSFLGLTQVCRGCHPPVHGEKAAACERCHTQEAFRPAARFDHGAVYPLAGAHARARCVACHRRYPADFAVPGRACRACHVSPHTAPNEALYGADCDRCHTPVRPFRRHTFPPPAHPARFPLLGAHGTLACKACHGLSSPPLKGLSPARCQSCHQNPHVPGGRAVPLADAGDCSRCHQGGTWKLPGRVARIHSRADFPLVGAHSRVDCLACHRPKQPLPPPPRDCLACHRSPHRVVLADTCRSCHGLADEAWAAARSRMSPAAHARTGFALTPPHKGLDCLQCHAPAGSFAARFPGRPPERCAACHRDPHGGQFTARPGGCLACHGPTAFLPPTFGPEDHRTFPLTGAHLGVACLLCHRKDAAQVRRFRGTPRRCAACHTDPHRGQLTGPTRGDCGRCHSEESGWEPVRFDHQRHSRFPLDGVHRRLACRACHPVERDPAQRPFVRYRPLGRECRDCHAVR